MKAWWASSPYYDVGIYALGSPSGPVNPKLNSTWVDKVVGYGWGIIPIWSGLQAPCACHNPASGPHKDDKYPNCRLFANVFSFAPDTAEFQGEEQAKEAYNSVTSLGLDGSIIYVDIENFAAAECGGSASAYVAGWNEMMHLLGGAGSARVYGGIWDANNLQYADDGYISRSDHRVTVWGLNHSTSSALTDTLAWTNKQRIHQYLIDVNEKWGGQTLHIDNDLVDATVVQSSGVKDMTPTSYTKVKGLPANAGLVGLNHGVNNSSGLHLGELIGDSESTPGSPMGFTYLNGNIVSMGANIPVAINNLGQIIGYNWDTGVGFYAPSSSGPFKTFPGLYGIDYAYYGINDAGWIIGVSDGQCALLKPDKNGAYSNPIEFDSPAGCDGINGLGQIIGYGPGVVSVEDVVGGDPNNLANFSEPTCWDSTNYFGPGLYINNNGGTAAFYDALCNGSDFVYLGPILEQDGQNTDVVYGLNDDGQIATGNVVLDIFPVQQ